MTDFQWPEKSKGFVDFHENTILEYGIPKIGKTTLASKFPDALFFLTEEGAKHVQVTAWHIKKWTDFCDKLELLIKAVKAGGCPFKTVVIDTIDNLSEFADTFICKKYGINTLGDLDYGKGYAYYKKELTSQLRKITQLGLGLIFISHAEEKDVLISAVTSPYAPITGDLQTGKVKMIVPTMERRAYQFISGLVDMIFYLEVNNNNDRVINTNPTKHFEAGDRSGRLPAVLPLDYDALLKAYYGADDGKPPDDLIDRINQGEQYLAQKKIDGFDVPTRVKNSRKKHIGVESLTDASIDKLESYLQHLRMKAKSKGGEKDASSK